MGVIKCAEKCPSAFVLPTNVLGGLWVGKRGLSKSISQRTKRTIMYKHSAILRRIHIVYNIYIVHKLHKHIYTLQFAYSRRTGKICGMGFNYAVICVRSVHTKPISSSARAVSRQYYRDFCVAGACICLLYICVWCSYLLDGASHGHFWHIVRPVIGKRKL